MDVFCTASTVRRRSVWIPSRAPISSRPEKEGEEGEEGEEGKSGKEGEEGNEGDHVFIREEMYIY